MRYERRCPSADLSAHVECYWFVKQTRCPGSSPGRADTVVPDGCMEIIFQLADPFYHFRTPGGPVVQPNRFLVGQITGPMWVAPVGAVDLAAIRFRPGGTVPFLEPPAGEITNRTVELDRLFSWVDACHEQLRYASVTARRVAVLETFLRGSRRSRKLDADVAMTLDLLRNSRGAVTVGRAARAVGRSERTLERKFVREVGLGPKRLARVIRLHHLLRVRRRQPTWSWGRLAFACGYADQAHCAREVARLTGVSPTCFDTAAEGLGTALLG